MIHYHGAGGLDLSCRRVLRGRHALWSFAHHRNIIDSIRDSVASYCVDSGAFSAWKSGLELDLEAYRRTAEDLAGDANCDFIVGPDIITQGWEPNAVRQGTWFFHSGLRHSKQCPVWHTSEEPGSLKHLRYLSQHYAQVAIGSSADYPLKSPQWWRVLHKAWDMLAPRGAPVVHVHGFRMLDPDIIEAFPWGSCDSATASMNIRDHQRQLFGVASRATKATRFRAYCEALEDRLPPRRYQRDRAVQGGLFTCPADREATIAEREASR